MNYIKEFSATLEILDRSKTISTVFLDFLTLSMCSLAQSFYQNPNIEQRYKNTICNWKPKMTPNTEKTPQVGLEPTTYRLTAGCSAIELLRIILLIFI